MGRIDAIRHNLSIAQERGTVRPWYVYNPGDGKGRRWVLTFKTADFGWIDRTLSTREAELVAAELACGILPRYDQFRTGS